MKVILSRGKEVSNKQTIAVPLGFSWICFFFGWWVPLLKQEWRWFFIMSSPKILSVLMIKIFMGVKLFEVNILVLIYLFGLWSVFDLFTYFKYNELNLMSKLSQGFRPMDSHGTNLIKRRYPRVAYKFELVKES